LRQGAGPEVRRGQVAFQLGLSAPSGLRPAGELLLGS
jgi:hypothetical protein